MRKYGRYMIVSMYLLCLFSLILMGMVLHKENTFYDNYITIANTSGTYEQETLTNLENIEEKIKQEQEQTMTYTLWGEEKEQQVKDRDNLRQSNVTVLTLWGSSWQIIPYGKILQKEDTTGCLVDRTTAEQLFGNYQAEGLYVQYKERLFQVRGVINVQAPVLVIQHQNDMGGTLNRITMERKQGDSVVETVEKFLAVYGVNGEPLRFDFYRSPEWILELIPGKWSDFDGWKKNILSYQKKWSFLQQAQKGIMEHFYENQMKKEVLCFLVAGGMMVLFCITGGKYYSRKHNSLRNIKMTFGKSMVK